MAPDNVEVVVGGVTVTADFSVYVSNPPRSHVGDVHAVISSVRGAKWTKPTVDMVLVALFCGLGNKRTVSRLVGNNTRF